ncbi:hypothetical protein NJI34_37785 [Pseudomonas sp. S 311-6]|nr:hypothetical protein [Pseudomonas sp. S 311-6]
MATRIPIPVGQQRQSVALGLPAARAPMVAVEDPTGRALGGASDALGNVANQWLQKQAQAEEQVRRVQSVRILAESKYGLDEIEKQISQGVLDGSIPKDNAGQMWQESLSKLIEEKTASLDPRIQESVRTGLLDTQYRLAGNIRDTIARRTQQDFGSELVRTRAALLRDAQSDRRGANRHWEEILASQGPLAGMNPEQIARDLSAFRQDTAQTEAYGLINGARNNMQALQQAESRLQGNDFADLDPQRKAVLLNTAAGFRASYEQRAVAAAQRAEIAAAKRDREAAAAFNELRNLADDGKVINPEYAATVAAKVAGTPYADALPQVLNQAPEGRSFAMQSLATQRQIIDALDAQGHEKGWTPESQKRREALQKSYDTSIQEYKDEPLRAALERGVLPELAPLDMSGGVSSLMQGIEARMAQAATVQTVAGKPVSPFTSDEAKQVATLLQALPVDQRATTLATLASTVGPQTSGALASQIDSKDRTLALAVAYGDQRKQNGGLVSESLIRGQQAIDDKRVLASEVSEFRSQVARSVRGAYASVEMEDAVIDSAVLYLADQRANRQTARPARAIEDLTGGIVEFNGGKIPLPQGMNESAFKKALRTVTPDSLAEQAPDGKVYVGHQNAVPMDLQRLVDQLPDAVLRHAGQGQYTISAGATGVVRNAAGQPIILRISNGTR